MLVAFAVAPRNVSACLGSFSNTNSRAKLHVAGWQASSTRADSRIFPKQDFHYIGVSESKGPEDLSAGSFTRT